MIDWAHLFASIIGEDDEIWACGPAHGLAKLALYAAGIVLLPVWLASHHLRGRRNR